ncbi:MAG: SagB/ThcOx family dehydrogenase [Desulfobulbales bacterium]|nr:SagB/ThcOx family dehydrogenase [Desulfobulbales bacterium]
METTLQKRRSVRSFQNVSLSLQAVSQLLWAAQGLSGRHGLRTAPSAGALYPLDMYVAAGNVDGLATGIYRYDPADHALVLIKAGNHLDVLSRAALGQAAISLAPVSFVITGKERRTTGKYGARGVRYMLMESGHAAQNLCLQAVALGLDSVTIGAFSDRETAAILAVEKGATPLYIIPVGKGARN